MVENASAASLSDGGVPPLGTLAVAGFASLGAGAIHAAAIGVHGEHRQAAVMFALLSLVQITWGVAATLRSDRTIALAGVGLSVVAVGGWVMAKTVGISFVDGLGELEVIQFADAAAAGLALVGGMLCLRNVMTDSVGSARAAFGPVAVGGVAAVVAVISLVAMTATGGHAHAGGHDETATAPHDETVGHDDSGQTSTSGEGHDAGSGHGGGSTARPYDPNLPIDLSGVAGVTPTEQARAENLIAITLARLPRFADPAVAEAQGFRSIGDGFTGFEHFINWGYISDDHILDPDYPESLVYETGPDGSRTLVSAMFMLTPGARLSDVPELGGALTQWHIHDDLCFTDDPQAPMVAGLTSVGGTCQPPLKKLDPTPMIHVWIRPHPCGPFAALEGVAGGQVPEGEQRLCDTAHGG